MNRLVCLVFVSLQVAPLLGLSAEDYSPESTLRGRARPTLTPQKCCSLKKMFSTEHQNCTDVTPALFSKVRAMWPFLGPNGHLNCSTGMMIILNDLEGQNYTLLTNGSLYEPVRSRVHSRDRYCYDYMLEHGRFMPMICIEEWEIETPVDESVGSDKSEHENSVGSDKSAHGKSVGSDKSEGGNSVTQKSTGSVGLAKPDAPKNGSDSKKPVGSDSHSGLGRPRYLRHPNHINDPKAAGFYDREKPGNGLTYDRSVKSQQPSGYSLLVLGLSILVLSITLIVFVIESDLHYYQFDLSFIGHLTSLIIGLGSIIASRYWANELATCGILAYTRQFSILFSFSWLNVMGIHICRSMDLSGDRLKLNGRCHIGLLFPLVHPFSVLIITFLANISNFLDESGFAFNDSCWFRHCKESNPSWLNPEFIYFYINVLIMLSFNLGLFVIIAFKVLFQNFNWRPDAEQNGRTIDPLCARFGLCCKIFFVMGLIWFADVTAFFVEDEALKWLLRNLTVFIHSFFIFINFMGSDRVINLLLRSSSVGQKIKTMHCKKNVVYIPDGSTPRVMMI